MMKFTRILLAIALTLLFTQCGNNKKADYETVDNDPLNARIYKLDNGLTIYMTVYKDAPRIQTYVAVKAGSKNDPADATGLAHYLEHMLFKGTDKFGSKDFSKEEPELKKIEELYEVYRQTKDVAKRKSIYHEIDSISGVAAKFAIANEYDKMMASIGAVGTNAYTSFEQTVYVDDIPSNQVDKWLTIQAERFRKPAMRLFHTELEAVYEEKNRGLDNDDWKAFEAFFAALFQVHPYGTQTTIGTIDHLKNPSIKKINEYYNNYYVPNNMAICLSGDFNPDSLINVIRTKFGSFQSKPVPEFKPGKETPITAPVVREVVGPDAEQMYLGYRFDAGANTQEDLMTTVIARILSNDKAGLIDLNLNQKQEILGAGAGDERLKDYNVLYMVGRPKQGQKLEEVKDKLLAQIEKIKAGDFPEWLLEAIINNAKLSETKSFEDNQSRANAFVESFTKDIPWKEYIARTQKLAKVTKQDVVDFAKKNLNNNYVVVYKRTGEDKNIQKVEKPAITPVTVNRDDQSEFLKQINNTAVKDIEPVFVDFKKDIKTLTLKNNIPVYYTENTENKTFNLYYLTDMGTNNNKKLSFAIKYLDYLGTSKYTPEQVKQEFYKIACSYGVSSSEDQTYVYLTGLSENFDQALTLFEELLNDAKSNPEALKNLVFDELKVRQDELLNKQTILFQAMSSYAKYGEKSSFTNLLTEEELNALTPEELINTIKSINTFEHKALYYGSATADEIVAKLNTMHKTPEQLSPIPTPIVFTKIETKDNVYVIDYDMKQAEIMFVTKGDIYNKDIVPQARMYNEYFGAGMSSVVFQELRESKALAYSVFSRYRLAKKAGEVNYNESYIGTQNDKLSEAMAGMTGLLNNMPESEPMFNSAKQNIIQGIRTERITKENILFSYISAQKLGLDDDIRKDIYAKVPSMTIADAKAFQNKYVKDKTYNVMVLGKKEDLDFKTLEKYGKVKMLKLKDVFGYDKNVQPQSVLK